MKKIKSFTLVEVLIATVIFASVAVIATSSASMIISSTNKSDDLTKSEVCIRQVYDYVRASIQSSNPNHRFMPVTQSGTTFQLVTFGDVSSENSKEFVGIAYFTQKEKLRIIYKSAGAYYQSAEQNYNSSPTATYVQDRSTDGKIHSDECSFFTASPMGSAWAEYDFAKPFTISRNADVQRGDLSKSENRSYLINLKDVAYRSKSAGKTIINEADAQAGQIFSRLDLTVSESLKSL